MVGPPRSKAAATPSEHDQDEAIVAGLVRGERRAVTALFEQHSRHIRRILLNLLSAEPDVPDLLHDVFVHVIERIRDLKDPAALRGWLSGMAVLTARGYIRRRRRFWLWPQKRAGAFQPSPRPAPDVSSALRAAYGVLDRLPTDDRIAFVLRAVGGMKIEEIADATGKSLATVKRRLKRADERFRLMVAEEALLKDWLEP